MILDFLSFYLSFVGDKVNFIGGWGVVLGNFIVIRFVFISWKIEGGFFFG